MKRFLVGYKPKSYHGCYKQREFDTWEEVQAFILRISKRGSHLLYVMDEYSYVGQDN